MKKKIIVLTVCAVLLARISHNVARERQRKAREASITMRWNAGWWAQQKIES